MGLLRLTLALAVLVAHTGAIFGLPFFDGGVMAVETFYIISGFYMALVLSEKYAGRPGDFFFNRFLRLFPIYWLLVVGYLAVALFYGIATQHPLGPLSQWNEPRSATMWAWTALSNLTILGSDWAALFNSLPTDQKMGGPLIAIPAAWSLAVEICFYLVAPALLGLRRRYQVALFIGACGIRWGLWLGAGGVWSVWLYYFAPASWIFFLAGVLAYHVMKQGESHGWFRACARPVGFSLLAILLPLIAFYQAGGWFSFQDWRYYTLVAASLPFLFAATRDLAFDSWIGDWSYPIYLGHAVVLNLSSPLRHFIAPRWSNYATLALTVGLCAAVMSLDRSFQRRFKRRSLPPDRAGAGQSA